MLSLFILVSVASAASSYVSRIEEEYVYINILNRCVPAIEGGIPVYARTTIDEDGETYTSKLYIDDECRIPVDASTSSLEGTEQGELPATVAYILESSDENCEKEGLGFVEGYRTGCNPYTSGETTYYVKSTVSGGQLTVQSYTDEECNSPIEGNNLISDQYDCDTCFGDFGEGYYTVYCKALKDSDFGTGSTKEPEPVDANTIQELKSKVKYMIMNIEGLNIYMETDKCIEVEGEGSMYIIIPSSDIAMMCMYEGSTCEAPEGTELSSICEPLPIGESVIKAYNKLPKNIAYMEISNDEECNDLVEGVGMIFPVGCQQLIEQQSPMAQPEVVGSFQYVVEEGKLKGTQYTDGECTAPDAEATPLELECDSCVNMEIKGKIICEPLSGGAFNTFLLLALVLIAFIF